MVPNRLGSRPGTGCGEAMLIAFTQVSRPEEGACRSRRERSSLPEEPARDEVDGFLVELRLREFRADAG